LRTSLVVRFVPTGDIGSIDFRARSSDDLSAASTAVFAVLATCKGQFQPPRALVRGGGDPVVVRGRESRSVRTAGSSVGADAFCFLEAAREAALLLFNSVYDMRRTTVAGEAPTVAQVAAE